MREDSTPTITGSLGKLGSLKVVWRVEQCGTCLFASRCCEEQFRATGGPDERLTRENSPTKRS